MLYWERRHTMSIRLKSDILALLKEAGYTTYKLRQEKLLGERAIQKLRTGDLPSWNELNTICSLLNKQVGDLVEYIPDEE